MHTHTQVPAYLGKVGMRDSLTCLPALPPCFSVPKTQHVQSGAPFTFHSLPPALNQGTLLNLPFFLTPHSPAITKSVHQNIDHSRSNPFALLHFPSFCPEATMSHWPMRQPLIGPPAAILSLSPCGSRNTNPSCHCPAEITLRGAL